MGRPFWYNVVNLLPQVDDQHLMRSKEVLAKDGRGVIRVAFVQYHDCKLDDDACPGFQWKLAGRDFYDFENVVAWMPLSFLP